MNLNIIYHPLLEAVGAALVHSLWQGALVAGALYLALRMFRSADVRYALCGGALVLMFLLPVSTGVQIYLQNQSSTQYYTALPNLLEETDSFTIEQSVAEAVRADSEPLVAAPVTQNPLQEIFSITFAWRPFFVWMWIVGVVAFSLRWMIGLIGVHRLKSSGLQLEDDSVQSIFDSMVVQLGISRKVRLQLTLHIDQPVVVGWLKPMVLLPVSVATSLPPDQIEAILAHELAHVRRQDYLVLMSQSVMEILFFYHPLVWWVSHRMCIEREYCCDDLATMALNNELTYLTALANLDNQRVQGLALAANDASLLDRVRRIVDRKSRRGTSSPFSWLGAGLLVIGCSLLITACVNWGQPDLDGTPEELYSVALEKIKGRNFTSAKLHAERAAEQGDMCSMQLLIQMYDPRPERHYFKDGTSVPYVRWGAEDEEVAMEWAKAYGDLLHDKAESGDSMAMVWLYLFQAGIWNFHPLSAGGVVQNDSLANMWLERAYAVDNPYAIRYMGRKAIIEEGDYEKGDQLFARAAELGDERAYWWWVRADTQVVMDRYFKVADLLLTNRSPEAHGWLKGEIEAFNSQVEQGNEEAIPWKMKAESLRILERLEEIPEDPDFWAHPFAEFQEMRCNAEESLFWDE